MPKTNIKVFIRFRPAAVASELIKYPGDGSTIIMNKRAEKTGLSNQQESMQFSFDGVFDSSATQETVYQQSSQDVVSGVLSGYNGTVFAYGQTGGGKTFTISGDIMSFPHRGVIPRAIHQIFQEIDMRVDKSFKVRVSYLEIYNDAMYDLLSDTPGNAGDLQVIEEGGATRVVGLRQVEVASEEEALNQFFLGEQGRSTSDHVLNKNSSRSHCIFTIYLEVKTSSSTSERAVVSKLNLVDLAGSERVKRTNASGQVLLEATYINKSLTFLEQVVQALGRRESHVPYRQTKLTSVLRDALGGNCRTVMLANLWHDDTFAEESASTLRFAARVRMLLTEPIVNESSDPEFLVRKYQRQVKELRQELAMRDSLMGRSFVNYADATEAELAELRQLLARFLEGEVDVNDLPVDSLKRVRETFQAFRALYLNLKSDSEARLATAGAAAGQPTGAAAASPGSNGAASGAAGNGAGGAVAFDETGLVGDVDAGGAGTGIQIGQAPTGARPAIVPSTGGPGSPPRPYSRSASAFGGPGELGPDISGFMGPPGSPGMPSALEANGAFYRFRTQVPEGLEVSSEIKRLGEDLKAARLRAKASSQAVNDAKAAIDRLAAAVEGKRAETEAAASAAVSGKESDVTDQEEHSLLQQLKAAKVSYRDEFGRYKDAKTEMDTIQTAIGERRQVLIERFNTWFGSEGQSFGFGTLGGTLGGEDMDGTLGGTLGGGDASQSAFMNAVRTMRRQKGAAAAGGAVRR